jgi:hypothetical protein
VSGGGLFHWESQFIDAVSQRQQVLLSLIVKGSTGP